MGQNFGYVNLQPFRDTADIAALATCLVKFDFSRLTDDNALDICKLGTAWPFAIFVHWVLHVFQKAATRAGIGVIGTHTMHHTYRSWLDAVETTIAVQQKMMRHPDIRTTMKYGDVVANEIAQASGKVAALALGTVVRILPRAVKIQNT